jgi:hypothetical protein
MAKVATERLSTSPIACRMRAPRCTARGFCSKAAISRTLTLPRLDGRRGLSRLRGGDLPPRANQDCEQPLSDFKAEKALSKKRRKIKA